MNRLLAFAFVTFVFMQVPAFTGDAGTWIDLMTPFVVIGTAAWVLRDAPRRTLTAAVLAAILYVDGHGIHLAANDIRHFDLSGAGEDRAHFWDERWGHLEWHLGLLGLLGSLALADARRGRPERADLLAALLLGWTLFTITVEGQDWFLLLAAAVAFTAWALARPARTRTACAVAMLVGAALVGVWAAWQGGVPQFSELGWL